jgi:hypothetical protein
MGDYYCCEAAIRVNYLLHGPYGCIRHLSLEMHCGEGNVAAANVCKRVNDGARSERGKRHSARDITEVLCIHGEVF